MALHNQKPYTVLVTTISDSKPKHQNQLNASKMQEVCKPIASVDVSSRHNFLNGLKPGRMFLVHHIVKVCESNLRHQPIAIQ
jgi:hypothetical protein